ncbi:MAG: HNH endonuclease [Candidatus Aenigmatarchaeota archaeon]
MEEKRQEFIIANITWNKSGWRSPYVNPHAGHRYARDHPGGESLNFDFNKKMLDNDKEVFGFIQCTYPPKYLAEKSIIFFYSKNLENRKGEIVGIYGNARFLEKYKETKWSGFENNKLLSNIVGEKELSLLFPIALDAKKYSNMYYNGKRLVPQVGYRYKDVNADIAKTIICDEIEKLQVSGITKDEYEKLTKLFKLVTGEEYSIDKNKDIQEEEEFLEELEKESKTIGEEESKKKIIQELKVIIPQSPELINFKGKQYKRDNKTISQLKILRDFKCQICGNNILKKDGKFYIEAAHITPKKDKGAEVPINILILCPNHHKEFDLGNKKIIEKDESKIKFELNGKEYNINLNLD